MKRLYILSLGLLITSATAQAQISSSDVNFDPPWPGDVYKILIDTTNPSNCWQVGMPQKFLTNNAPLTVSRGIITDSVQSYPAGDTSVFIYKTYLHATTWFFPMLDFDYRTDTDTLSDYGTVEISSDNGQTWNDILADAGPLGLLCHVQAANGSMNYNPQNASTATLFTGISNGWYHVHCDFLALNPIPDTVEFRFTFYSDTIQTNRQGWLLDNFQSNDNIEGIAESNAPSFSFTCFPNPATDFVNISIDAAKDHRWTISLYDAKGDHVLSMQSDTPENGIDLRGLAKGAYVLRITDENGNSAETTLLKK